jgi:hypothetical protein
MKCPKCGYISFDYNDVCPKCNKDITAEREKMNLPAYMPNPPSLLAALTGESSESDFDLKVESPESEGSMEQEVTLSPEDSQAIEAMEEAFHDSQELEIELDTTHEDRGETVPQEADLSDLAPETEEEIDLKLDFSGEDSEPGLPQEVRAGGEEVAPEKEISPEDSETGPPKDEQVTAEELDLELDLSGKETEPGLPQEVRAGGEASETGPPKDEQAAADEIDLELDLSGEDFETSTPKKEQAAGDDIAVDLDLSSSEIPDSDKTAIFDPLKIDEESGSFDLDDLSGVEPGGGIEAEISVEAQDEALLDLEGLDSILEESIEGLESPGSAEGEKDENLSLDLESLDLDLDLETPEDKSS